MDKLQKISDKAEILFRDLFNAIMLQIGKKSFTAKSPKQVRKMVLDIFNEYQYEEQAKSIIGKLSLESTALGLGKKFVIAEVDKYIDWRLNTTYKGVTLSKRIRDNAKDVQLKVSKTIVARLKAETNWKALSKEIVKVDKVGNISGKLADLAEEGKKLLNSPEEIANLQKMIHDAQKYINKLSPGDAPTKFLKASYQKVIDSVVIGDTGKISKATEKAIAAKIKYNSEQISRTEIGRAYGQAFRAQIENDDDISGFEWVLSSRHPEPDQCDFYAELDNGMGKGIYSKKDFPELPAHPNCLCSLVPYVGKAPKETTDKAAIKYLGGLTPEKRAKIIGAKNAENKSRYIAGLKNKGINFKDQPESIPDNLIQLSGG